MEQRQRVSATSLWSVQGPYDINSIIIQQEESSEESSQPTDSVKLVPPPSTNDDNTPACQLLLTCGSCTSVRSLAVISNARHLELYDDLDAYCSTVKGERQGHGEGDREMDVVLYEAQVPMDTPLPHCRIKFVSLTDKSQLTLSKITVTTVGSEDRSLGVGGRSIDMAKVRDIMGTLPRPIPPNVQDLMASVEQYQKNQSSVIEDLQQAATTRLTASSNDPRASVASNMAGLLSAFSKASMLQQSTRTHPTSGDGVQSNRNNSEVTPSNNKSSSDKVNEAPSDMSVLSKLMSSFSGGNSSGNDEGRDGVAEPRMLNALRTMCRDVSHMRAADRQLAGRPYEPDGRLQQEHPNTLENTSESTCTSQSEKSPYGNGMKEVEQRLMGYIADMEKRIMGRMDRRLELLQDHIDLRFNKLEVLLNGPQSDRTMNAAKQEQEYLSVDLD